MEDIYLSSIPGFIIRKATVSDLPVIHGLVRELADYERLSAEFRATISQFESALFGTRRVAEAILGEYEGKPVGVAIFFHNFSTFVGKPGLFLEDLYITPQFRGLGLGRAMLGYLAKLAVERDCGRFEWWVLDWNTPAVEFYRGLGAQGQNDWRLQRVSGEALKKLAGVSPDAAI